MPASTMGTTKAARCREYYSRNQPVLQQKARERASKRKATMSDEDREEMKRRHREAAARYRAANRLVLKMNAWKYR
ncbi:hypothetical protein Hypma_015382 [Hypsizygus marmoreus]|uniref:Uncharacterized protein n=1 Tax=Hypsizygus marmoreus TaxID=39966 RepID=A0A369KAQ9_HYPMA|nr:hypothetical protein Hypma_015382 [Hypsizygus marmoreus]